MNKIDFSLRGKCGVYVLRNTVNGKRYIGSSVNLYNRLHEHLHNCNFNVSHNSRLQEEWNSYGAEAFEYEILEFCVEDIHLNREEYYLKSLQPEYNKSCNLCGNLGRNTSLEMGSRISETLKRKYASGELVTYKQQHAWQKTYIYNAYTAKLVAVCNNKVDASRLLFPTAKIASSAHMMEGTLLCGKYIIKLYTPFNDYNELRNYINEFIFTTKSKHGKYFICKDENGMLYYYRSFADCARDNGYNISQFHKIGQPTIDKPWFLTHSNRFCFFHDEYIPVQYDAVPIEKSSELLPGNIGEDWDVNTEINSEITEGSESS